MRPIISICLGLPLVLFAGTRECYGHHASSGLYDGEATITIQGRITSVLWRNPHVRFTVIRVSDQGEGEPWEIEAGSVNTLERIGIRADLLEPGKVVEISGSPGRSGAAIMFAEAIVSAEGAELPLNATIGERYGAAERDRGPVPDIFRVWVPVSVPNTGAGLIDFPLTESARAARAVWDPVNDPALRCIPPGMPAAMDNPYPIEFEDHEDYITLRLEEWDGVRTIHMRSDGAESAEPTPMGYSVGRWDGDSLIVETTHIRYPYFDDLGTPQSDAIRLMEDFRFDPDAGRLSWVARIVDPEVFTEPVVLEIEWEWVPGNEIKPFNCALGPGD